jgi:hypothetical protein
MNHTRINPSDARDVLGYDDHDGDRECGDFKRNLITVIICAGPRAPDIGDLVAAVAAV